MTLPKNFPGRKNQRRVEALERMKDTMKNRPLSCLKGKTPEQWLKATEKQIKHLEAIIAKPFQTHTKKNRVGTGSLLRI